MCSAQPLPSKSPHLEYPLGFLVSTHIQPLRFSFSVPSAELLKTMLVKGLSQGSPKPIEPSFFTADYHLLHHSSSENILSPNNSTGLPPSFDLEEGITYAQMQTVIEEVLEESGYYNLISNRYHSYPWGNKNHPNNR
ncbi:serine/threonine-protein kinase Nek10-like [Vicugna pacos]|uniref:Serine/threonine-protein kinase Nek10-like n=1 Tax=Vicugna pacos TaxID=30538 RepID=A0ABM5BKN9_VICPA